MQSFIKSNNKGETPIAKNVEVVDLSGKSYEATYIKRAKGLVKSGRAMWSDNNKSKICLLVSSAQTFEEDNKMEIYDNNGNKMNERHSPGSKRKPGKANKEKLLKWSLDLAEACEGELEQEVLYIIRDAFKSNPEEDDAELLFQWSIDLAKVCEGELEDDVYAIIREALVDA